MIKYIKLLLDKILFSSIDPLMKIGKKRSVNENDIPELEPDLDPIDVEKSFSKLDVSKPYKFIIACFFASGKSAKYTLLIEVIRLVLALSGSLLLRSLILNLKNLNNDITTLYTAIGTAVILAIVSSSEGIITQHFYFFSLKIYARISDGLSLRLFKHTLKLKNSAKMKTQTGDIVNHMASDCDGVAEVAFFLPELLHSLMLTIGVVILLFSILGMSAFASLLVLVIFSPLAKLAAKRFSKTDNQMWKSRDERITLMAQILTGIRVIKYFAWEKSILKEVSAIREKEINAFITLVKTDALSTLLFVMSSTLVSFFGFSTFVLLGGNLTAEIIFPCIMLFGLLEQPFGNISHFIKNVSHSKIASIRLHNYFNLNENVENKLPESSVNKSFGVRVKDLNLQYPGTENFALKNISFEILSGESVAIIGSVGSGKSSLLLSLLGETDFTDGTISFLDLPLNEKPRISYVPQEAFIMNSTVRENIMFEGSNSYLNDDQMISILNDSALINDISNMKSGLETEIGERGVNLSGGQKQRLSLARAIVKMPGLVLLDDPLSAVDISTETHLIDQLIFGRWNTITRIIVTHRLSYLNKFDKIIFLNNGVIDAVGKYDDLLNNSIKFKEFYDEQSNYNHNIETLNQDLELDVSYKNEDSNTRITDDEEKETGSVKFEVFKSYIKALGGENKSKRKYIYLMLVLSSLLVTLLPIMQSSWLAWWSDNIKIYKLNEVYKWFLVPINAVIIFGCLGFVILIANYFERLIWMLRATIAGRDIHNKTLKAVLNAPIRFFDSTPMGRILNRFSRDVQGVDEELSWNFESTIRSLTSTLGSLFLIIFVSPIVLVFVIPTFIWYYKIQKNYREVAREAKRIESISRSPRFAHFKETITGLTVIRSYGREQEFTKKFIDLLSFYQRQYWRSIMVNRWFSARAPLIAGVITLTTGVSASILAYNGNMKVGIAGMIVMYALNFWGSLNWAVRSFSEVEMRMTGVERLNHYSRIEPEKSTTKGIENTENLILFNEGKIEFKNVFARYRDDLPLVLNNVNFIIPGGIKVGIIGRTGSGKTTLFQTLFRFFEIEKGEVLIDEVNIAQIPLAILRPNIAIIPQDPLLFIGTIRTNLDRFNQFTDFEIIESLKRVQMKETIIDNGGLNAIVYENGGNYSQGQRQLLCLARAILTNAKIIVLDEATASVDVKTDSLIQETIQKEFDKITVLIIAHRLNSVVDCEMIIEMNDGKSKILSSIKSDLN